MIFKILKVVMISWVLTALEEIKIASKASQSTKIQVGKMLLICEMNMNETENQNTYFVQIVCIMCSCMMTIVGGGRQSSLREGYNYCKPKRYAHVFCEAASPHGNITR